MRTSPVNVFSNDQQYVIRRADLRDVHAIRRLELVVFPKDAYSYLNLTSLLAWPGGANFVAATASGLVVGFVSGTPDFTTHVDWIVTLGVHPDHQSHGLGRRLLEMSEATMTQDRLRLTVRASNDAARHLYESSGYQFAYLESHYYNDGENGIVLEKQRQRE
jgi:[ribosomal protein S18]-alanine N-acetyltransferase